MHNLSDFIWSYKSNHPYLFWSVCFLILIITVKVYRVILTARSRRSKLQDNEDLIEFAGQKFPVEIVKKLKAVGINTPNQLKNASKKQLISSGINKNLIENIWWKRQKDKSGNRKIKEKIEADQERKAAEAAKKAEQKRKEKEEAAIQVEETNITYKRETKTNIVTKSLSKKKNAENLPKSIVEPIGKTIENRFVDYTSNFSDNENSFPILKIPNKDCIVRTHRFGTTKRKGFKDESFEKSISAYFSNKYQVSGDVRLNTGKSTRPFEPDIAIICSTNKNIRIDVEIDEPYAGITRQPTHCTGEDVNRDNYFRDRGWIVIRFSEYQIHTKEKECLKFIATIINSIDSSFQIPNDLQSLSKIQNENLWDIMQAQKWEKVNYRENYLKHTFSALTEKQETIKRDFNKQEIEEEKLVKPTSFGLADKGKEIGFNKINSHKRDKRIKFYSEEHIYTIDGVPVPSASTIISRFFPEFDAVGKASNLSSQNPLYGLPTSEIVKTWKDRGIEAANKGTFLHEQIENYYLKQPYKETDEFYQFLNFVKEHNDLKPYRSEWRIFDETHNIAGTIDLLVENDNGSFDIYDWKRSKKVVNQYNGQIIKEDTWGNTGIGILRHIDDTSYNRYELQQNLYRHILEEKYGIKISDMYLIVMHTDEGYTNYHKVKVPHLTSEINSILQTV